METTAPKRNTIFRLRNRWYLQMYPTATKRRMPGLPRKDASCSAASVSAWSFARAPNPDIATIEALKQTMLSAGSIVYNTASSGLYLEKLFERIGIAEQIKAKTTRYPNGN
jgi:hypothetical protein